MGVLAGVVVVENVIHELAHGVRFQSWHLAPPCGMDV